LAAGAGGAHTALDVKAAQKVLPAVLVALTVTAAVACRTAPAGVDTALRGQRIEVLAVWSGTEQERFERVIDAFERSTGAEVDYTSAGHGVPTELDARFAEGRPPDVAFIPQPGLLRRYAAEGRLVPLDGVAAALVARNYGATWRALGSAEGRPYGVWFKAANKSLVWYNVGVFEQAGVVPPDSVDGLLDVAWTLAAAGIPAFSVGGADGWTLTDWFENVYLRVAGPEHYDLLAAHRIPWTDESVRRALRLLARLLDPTLVAGGTETALTTGFEASVENTFAIPPAAGMVFEGDFVAGVVTAKTGAQLGIRADVFPFPTGRDRAPAVVGGGDAAVLLRESGAGAAFLRFLASAEAAAIWAAQGGFISPNVNLDISVYPDEISRSVARRLLEAGDDFRFDLSDLQPAAFGASREAGLRRGLQDFLRDRDVDATVNRLEAEASAAFPR
jgi:alpha-glucoside transport system substrate-binding protein